MTLLNAVKCSRIKEENPEGSLRSSVMCHATKGKEAMKKQRIPEKGKQSVKKNKENTICSAQF